VKYFKAIPYYIRIENSRVILYEASILVGEHDRAAIVQFLALQQTYIITNTLALNMEKPPKIPRKSIIKHSRESIHAAYIMMHLLAVVCAF
jgi:hypothetical protein